MHILDKIYGIHGVVTFDAAYKLLIVLHSVRLMRRCCNAGLLSWCSSVHLHTHTHTQFLERCTCHVIVYKKCIILCLVVCLFMDWL
jgi:hypothetical protein